MTVSRDRRARLAVHEHSTGTERHPIVLLHGLQADSSDWSTIVPGLTADHRVIAIDLPGHGGSERRTTYSLAEVGDDVSTTLRELDLHDIALVGHSLGALVALHLAQSQPRLVRSLVLEEPPPPIPLDRPPLPRPPGPLTYDWPVVNQVRAQLRSPDQKLWRRLGDLRPPTLLLAGGPTSQMPQPVYITMRDRIPAARLVTADAGHNVHRAAPEEFLRAVRQHLSHPPTDPTDAESFVGPTASTR